MSAAVLAQGIFVLSALFLSLSTFRHLFYSITALLRPRKISPRLRPSTHFTVLIPAHNEEAGIRNTIVSAGAISYPKESYRIIVLADNCTDGTARVARSMGVEVRERHDMEKAGKGHALDWFISQVDWADDSALLCLDADSLVDPDALGILDAHIAGGADAVQAYNGCKEARSSLAALSLLTNTMKNAGTYAGRASLGLPAPMMNGWCLRGRVLREFGWKSTSITEDFEQTLRLAADGVFCRFAPGAMVRSEKARTFGAATAQRMRWSGGQSRLSRTLGWFTLKLALTRRSYRLFELSMDIMLPGYATSAAYLALLCVIAAYLEMGIAVAVGLAGLLFLLLTALIGFFNAGPSLRLAAGVLLAPVFIVWKFGLSTLAALRPPKDWRRSKRD